MAHKTPLVVGNTLLPGQLAEGRTVTVGTPAWFAWLDEASSFFFSSPSGTFTACRERGRRGGWYWRAHSRRSGKVRRVYLGKAAALTPERLGQVAATLAALAADQTPASTKSAQSESGERLLRFELTEAESSLATNRRRSRREEDDLVEPLVATKLLFPPSRANLVPRPRLAERLDEVLQYKLTLVSAPAGFGKTTLLAQWSSQTACRVAWVSLDDYDDDPARFWSYFIGACRQVYPGLAIGTLNPLPAPSELTMRSSLAALINLLTGVPEHFVVVLDDYHVIQSQLIHRSVDYLLDHLPVQVHLVIATRSDPPLALGRLRGKGQMTELRAADLSFTAEEAATFLNQVMKLDLTENEAATLGERAEGWAVGLQMAALSLRGREDKEAQVKLFAGEHRHVAGYLMEEVFCRLPADAQSFLLETSILDRLSAPLCETVTGRQEGQAMLETLVRLNLFTVPLDNERHWYRYHHLFADFLRARLRETMPERIPELSRRAAAWLADRGLPNEAVSQAMAAKEFETAADLIERHGPLLRKRGEVMTLLAWLKSLPAEVVGRRPRLSLLFAWLRVSALEFDAGEALLGEAERGWSGGAETPLGDSLGPEAEERRQFAAEALALRAQIATYRGNWPLAIRLGRQALERPSQLETGLRTRITVNLGSAYWQSGDIIRAREAFARASSEVRAPAESSAAISSLCSLANAQRVLGHLRDAAQTYHRVLDIVSEQNITIAAYASWPCVGLGRLRYEWNDLSGALRYADECIRLTRNAGLPFLLLAGYSLVERVKQAMGDLDGALETNQEAQHLAQLYESHRELPHLRAYEARLWLAQGHLEAAYRWARECGLSPDDQPSYERETEHLTLAQVLIAQGEADAALGLLERLRQAAEEGKRIGSLIKILAMQALFKQALGAGDEALGPLERALSLAEPEDYVRTIIDRGTSLATLLSRLLERRGQRTPDTQPGPSPTYIRSLLICLQPDAKTGRDRPLGGLPDNRGIIPLTDREREVLRLIAAGRSGREIAREFVVTLSTVKTHLRHIYAKLDAHGGKEAVAKARDLLLL